MSYAAAIDQLYALGQELVVRDAPAERRKFDLAHMRTLAASLGYPQRQFASVLVAGTNGKGSTAATLATILTSAGYRTGLYTSPHLLRVNERIQVSVPTLPSEYASSDVPSSAGVSTLIPISDEDFGRHYFRVDAAAKQLLDSDALPHAPSFFEMLTAVSFLYFAERHVDIAILEVGLGGRLDATNIVDPMLSIITDIALDHREYLGSTIAEIAKEKAGILRAGGTLITLPQHPEANRVFGEVAATLPGLRAISAASFVPSPAELACAAADAAPTFGADGVLTPEELEEDARTRLLPWNHYNVTVGDASLHIVSPLRGQHQQRNLALAIAAARELRNSFGYRIENAAMERGVRETLWPGRLQVVPLDHDRMLLVDVAHNPAGAWTLRAALAQVPAALPRTLLFGCLRDKDLGEMTQILFSLFDSSGGDPDRARDHIILVQIDSPRAAHVDDLQAAAERLNVPAHASPHIAAGFAQALEVTPEGGLIVATGSIYLVGEMLRLVQGHV